MPARDSDNWQTVNWAAEKFTQDDWAAVQQAREILRLAAADTDTPKKDRVTLHAVVAQLDVAARKINGRLRNGS